YIHHAPFGPATWLVQHDLNLNLVSVHGGASHGRRNENIASKAFDFLRRDEEPISVTMQHDGSVDQAPGLGFVAISFVLFQLPVANQLRENVLDLPAGLRRGIKCLEKAVEIGAPAVGLPDVAENFFLRNVR